jgi:hypothetical protein
MNEPIPDFAIFQNSRTRQSALWVKEVGEWKRCTTEDYTPILVMANMLRSSPDPSKTLNEIAKVIVGLGGFEELSDEGDNRIE